VACEAGTIKLWDVRRPDSPKLRFTAVASDSEPPALIRAVAFHPGGKVLASGSGDGLIKLWDLGDLAAAPRVLRYTRSPEFNDRAYSLAYSSDGGTLAVGYFGGAIRLWREGSPEPVLLPGHEVRVWSLAFTPDGRQLLSAGGDNDVRIWDLEEPTNPPLVLNHHQDEVRSVVVEADGKHFVSAGEDGRIVRSLLRTADLAAKVCDKVRHDISPQEWRLFVGEWADSFYERICPERPLQDGGPGN
jgi:WD40 repeat protein